MGNTAENKEATDLIVSNEVFDVACIETKTPEEESVMKEYSGLSEISVLGAVLKQGETLKVSGISDVENISRARQLRLTLRNIRSSIEKKRKELKEGINLKGKAIDGMANIIKAKIVPVENHLDEQEKIVEREKEKKLKELEESRQIQLAPYVPTTGLYNLRDISGEGFQNLLSSCKSAFEAQQEAERKAEEDRKAKEKADQEEKERLQAENKKLKEEQDKKDAEEAERRKTDEEKLKVERKAKEKAEAEARAIKDEQDRKDKEAAEKKAAEEQAAKEAEEKAKRAPDKEKLQKLAIDITSIELPKVRSKKGEAAIYCVTELLNKTSAVLKEHMLRFM